ncbi:MAG: phosphate acetyltransferase [Lachnospiraceae bacterium]|nr:phosphate acetyltransferase [Lachnospiraceae bacterium]
MSFIKELDEKLVGKSIKIVFPEGTEPRVLKGIELMGGKSFIKPILLGDENEILEVAKKHQIHLPDVTIVKPGDNELHDKYAERLYEEKVIPNAMVAKALLKSPNNLASAMVRFGDADTLISGIVTATSEVIAANKLILEFKEGCKICSSVLVQDCPHFHGEDGHVVILSDPAINIEPTEEELAEIAVETSKTAKFLLGREPRVAMLSFSTYGSAAHEKITKVRNALEIVKTQMPDLLIDGELQLDAAVSPSVAKTKLKNRDSAVAGRANTLIFPELNSANIGCKIMNCFGDALSLGAIVQGLKKPICDTSRGAKPEEICDIASIMATIVLNYTE